MDQVMALDKQVEKIKEVLIKGNLAVLSETERVQYYNLVCQSLGLNPYTKPFEFMKLQGKEILYAKKDATDQLRKIYNISIAIKNRETLNGVYCVNALARLPNGREDEDTGAVNIENLKGEMLANALMKAETKAKRRATLSICGLGFLDETEVDSIPQQDKAKEVQNTVGANQTSVPADGPLVCCNVPMKQSKFRQNELYCGVCKSKQRKEK